MKLSFSTLGCPQYGVEEIIAIARENSYEGVELRAVSGTVDLPALNAFSGQGLARTAAAFREAGLVVVCVGTSVRFSAADKSEQTKNLEHTKACLEIAAALGCRFIRTFGGPMPLTQSYTESMRWIWEGYNRLAELCADAGVTALLETHDDFSTSARVLDILGGVDNREPLGVIWDILHPYRFGEVPGDTFRALREHIRHVHIKDSRTFSPAGFDLALVGEGRVPVRECVELLRASGYDGYLSFEWEKLWHPEIAGPEVALPHYSKAMAGILAG